MARKKTKSESPTFEESLDQLKSIVDELENGKLTLSESLDRYEVGVKRLSECYQALNAAQKKIEQLVRIDAQGQLTTKPFDDRATLGKNGSDNEIDDEMDEDEFDDDDPDSLF